MLNNLIPVEWSNQRVLTTKQLAEYYDTTTERVSHNFSENKEHFVEGVHYFKLAGAARHAKMINTQQAWDVMRELVDFYFANKTVEPPPVVDFGFTCFYNANRKEMLPSKI